MQVERSMLEADVTFIPPDQGGRSILPEVRRGCRYRPNIALCTLEQYKKARPEISFGIALDDGPDDLQFGRKSRCRFMISFWSRESEKEFKPIKAGCHFVLLEGFHAVGYGEVIRRWEERWPSTVR